MVKVLTGNLLESKAQTFVNTVNCVGVMGKGIALQFKNEFPEMFNDYVVICERKELRPGKPYLFKRLIRPWILNFPTKDHWRSVSRIEDIIQGLKYLLKHYKEWGIKSLAVPPLGCGHGQLDWKVVGPMNEGHILTGCCPNAFRDLISIKLIYFIIILLIIYHIYHILMASHHSQELSP